MSLIREALSPGARWGGGRSPGYSGLADNLLHPSVGDRDLPVIRVSPGILRTVRGEAGEDGGLPRDNVPP